MPIGLLQKKVDSYWQIASLAHFFPVLATSWKYPLLLYICSRNVAGAALFEFKCGCGRRCLIYITLKVGCKKKRIGSKRCSWCAHRSAPFTFWMCVEQKGICIEQFHAHLKHKWNSNSLKLKHKKNKARSKLRDSQKILNIRTQGFRLISHSWYSKLYPYPFTVLYVPPVLSSFFYCIQCINYRVLLLAKEMRVKFCF